MVRRMAGIGLSQDEIAATLINPETGRSICASTLRAHCADELREGKAEAKAKVANRAYKMAISGDSPAMTMFWLKTQCGWRETSHHDVTSNGETIQQPTTVQIVGPNDDS